MAFWIKYQAALSHACELLLKTDNPTGFNLCAANRWWTLNCTLHIGLGTGQSRRWTREDFPFSHPFKNTQPKTESPSLSGILRLLNTCKMLLNTCKTCKGNWLKLLNKQTRKHTDMINTYFSSNYYFLSLMRPVYCY